MLTWLNAGKNRSGAWSTDWAGRTVIMLLLASLYCVSFPSISYLFFTFYLVLQPAPFHLHLHLHLFQLWLLLVLSSSGHLSILCSFSDASVLITWALPYPLLAPRQVSPHPVSQIFCLFFPFSAFFIS